MENNTVLVTGGAGYVGSHSCKFLSKSGYKVVAYDNLHRGWRDFVRWGELIQGDVRDSDKLAAAIKYCKPTAVLHCAGLAYVAESSLIPAEYEDVNTMGTQNVLNCIKDTTVRKLVFSSTCASYGLPSELPIDENHPQLPINPYGNSKFLAEKLITKHAKENELDVVILRYFNAAGAALDGALGERHEPETHLIPLAIRAALGLDPEFTIFGDGHLTRDGTAERDFVHVDDIARAHEKAIAFVSDTKEPLALNIGTSRGVTVREILSAVESHLGCKIPVIVKDARPGDPPSLVAASHKANEILDWQPIYSSLDCILSTAIAWERSGMLRRAS
jgi:UDP-arabinose 4-epimerase